MRTIEYVPVVVVSEIVTEYSSPEGVKLRFVSAPLGYSKVISAVSIPKPSVIVALKYIS